MDATTLPPWIPRRRVRQHVHTSIHRAAHFGPRCATYSFLMRGFPAADLQDPIKLQEWIHQNHIPLVLDRILVEPLARNPSDRLICRRPTVHVSLYLRRPYYRDTVLSTGCST